MHDEDENREQEETTPDAVAQALQAQRRAWRAAAAAETSYLLSVRVAR
jgi:hypothetical protein